MHLRPVALSGATPAHRAPRRPTAPTLRAALRRCACQVAGLAAGFVVVALVMLVTGGPGMAASNVGDNGSSAKRPHSAGDRIDRLVARHHCWRSAAPKDAGIPGHAVVALPGQRPRVAPADTGFAIWLDGRAGTLYAFCP